ncbi:UNVERIFIED_CONTAM: hypothetical protein K2H54_044060, partial [Gekko kuhli]
YSMSGSTLPLAISPSQPTTLTNGRNGGRIQSRSSFTTSWQRTTSPSTASCSLARCWVLRKTIPWSATSLQQ